MLARLIHWPFTRCCGLFILVLALIVITFSPTTGWAQTRGAGIGSAGVPEAVAEDGQFPDGSQGTLIESGGMGPASAGPLEVMTSRFNSPLVISAADFRNDGGAPNGYRFWFPYGYVESQGGVVYLMAPAYLPKNATVGSINVSFYDNGGATRPWLKLYRVHKDTGIVDAMATVATTATSTSIQNKSTATIANPLVVYPDYSYYVGVGLYSISQRLYSVRIYYSGS